MSASNRGKLFEEYARYWLMPKLGMALITDPFMRLPRDVMEELREHDPDAHALLSEYVVLPEKPNGT